MDKFTHITIFDRTYPPEKQAEGLAVSRAIVTGQCLQCGFLQKCSTDETFEFPVFAWCAQEKARILAEWNGQKEE